MFGRRCKKEIYITEESLREFTGAWCRPTYFIRRVLWFFRGHLELLENPDYKRLYDEALDFQFRHAVKSGVLKKKDRHLMPYLELLADMQSKTDRASDDQFSKELIDLYLNHRKAIWSRENR
ncbi:MAG: hypothetical protein IJX39_06665 [Clostridia bacterium]|nr:hypothetical protein [Clostridia bacterium]